MQLSPKHILKQYWGFDNFRPLQEEIIQSVLSKNDTLALLPTGGGKSICFQVPALLLDGICIVVSPLIALMKDQVSNLKARGIKAEALYSGLSISQIRQIVSNCIYGDVKFLYVSPERLATSSFKDALRQMKVNLLAVDEAHCISQWGYDFRPQYLQIAEVRELLPNVSVLALTATATQKVASDITEQLHFKKKQVFSKSFVRSNLSYVVRQTFDKNAQLLHILKQVPGSAVVYVNARKGTRQTADFLNKNGLSSDYYHAGLSPAERSSKQESWIAGKTRIIVCTNAFGMGIDKPDVRTVIHMNVPQSLEAYFQEAGRAGRDEKKAYAVLLCNQSDKQLLKDIIENFPLPEQLRQTYDALCNHLKIPLHQMPADAVKFNIAACAADTNIAVRVLMEHLRLLEQMDVLTMSEATQPYPIIKCLVGKDALLKLYNANPSLEAVTKMILRTSEGVFEDYTVFHEKEIAKRLGIETSELIAKVNELQKLHIFSYKPVEETPQISFTHERVESAHLRLNIALLQMRKQQTTERAAAMLQYISTGHFCRSAMLVNYFGEKFSENCGVCDVCIAAKKSGLKHAQFLQLMNELEQQLQQPKTMPQLVAATAQKPEILLQVLQRLADAELIESNAATGAFVWI